MGNGVNFKDLAIELRDKLAAETLRADTAEAELSVLKEAGRDELMAKVISLSSDLAGCCKEFEAAKRDALRYRYLRDPDNRDGLEPEDVIVVGIAEGEDIVWLEQLDQAVDAMIESAALNPKPEAGSHG